jgi:hypothetical protein
MRLLTYSIKKKWLKFVIVMTSLIFFPNGKLRFRLDYLMELIFLDYENLVSSRDYIKKISKLIKNEIN